jgi:hypothetical protein
MIADMTNPIQRSSTARRAWRSALQAAFLLLCAWPLAAQTVRPLIDENIVQERDKKAKGKIEYINDTLEPLTVTLDMQSFTVSDTGKISYRPLENTIHVKLSASSFRIAPKQSYLVFYEATTDSIPSWFVVYATFAGYKETTAEGLKIHLLLPHTIYLLPKQEVKKEELTIKTARYDPAARVVTVRVENTGSAFCRVLEAKVTSSQDESGSNGFPVFPHSEREVEIPWSGREIPKKLALQLEPFHLEQSIESTMP